MLVNAYRYSNLVICGDYNTSFDTAQTRSLQRIIESNNLIVSWDHSKSNKECTYTNYSLGHFSCIDHFLLLSEMLESINGNCVSCDPTDASNYNTDLKLCECMIANRQNILKRMACGIKQLTITFVDIARFNFQMDW